MYATGQRHREMKCIRRCACECACWDTHRDIIKGDLCVGKEGGGGEGENTDAVSSLDTSVFIYYTGSSAVPLLPCLLC